MKTKITSCLVPLFFACSPQKGKLSTKEITDLQNEKLQRKITCIPTKNGNWSGTMNLKGIAMELSV